MKLQSKQSKNPTTKSSTKKLKKSVLEYSHDDEQYDEDKQYVREHSWQFSDLNQRNFYYED